MKIATKRNGKILMVLGLLIITIGFFGFLILYSIYGQASAYMPLGGLFAFFLVVIGPLISVVGIPLFIIGAKRQPSKLIEILRTSAQMRTKISFLAQQLAINEKDVISIISRLRSNGHPISVDDSTLEAIYDPKSLPPSAKIKKPSMTLYEKLTVILTIIGIIISIIVAILT